MATHTLFGSTVPGTIDSADVGEVNLAVIFKSTSAGNITGVRFYKSSANVGTHIGTLRAMDTTLLGQVTFSGESLSGWQEMLFAAPIAIAANTQYQMTIYFPVGRYSRDSGFFNSEFSNPPLTGVADADTAAGNGQYGYGNSSTIPNASFGATNYWVDVIFEDTEPPSGNLLYPSRLDGLGYQFRGLE